MSSVKQYLAKGYSQAVAEQLAEQDEADLARRALELNANGAPPPPPPASFGEFPSNPAFWFEGTNRPSAPPAPQHGAAEGSGRFADLDRMAQEERDAEALIEQRVAAYQEGQPPVKPNQVLDVGGVRVAAYWGDGELELRRRDAAVRKLREGGRK